ncbi:hypothetical protein NDU88_003473 [Pleurodeles waltl]|uniref:Uncharacterized protein n=1 Tax=Pleurodeles waltl TaxID=8319 RepID=A0AAV7TPW2_PLEWA|nr:hypothetical protein NDU88_003473 [Pleurodeles waltl]
MALLVPTLAPIDPIRQLEGTHEKHTGMFDKVLQAIQDSKAAMESQLGTIQMETRLLRADHAKLAVKVANMEATLTFM